MIGRTRYRFHSVDSTQTVAFQLAKLGANHGTLVQSDFQTAGRGRLGRKWDAPSGTALTFSTLLRPTCAPHELGPLSIRIASVLCDVVANLGATDVALKWPNDVVIAGRKVSGILVQTRMMPDLAAVVGIGINISAAPESATHLQAEIKDTIGAGELLDKVVIGLDQMWAAWQPELGSDEIRSIEARLWLRGEQVTLQDADREITGIIVGVTPDGALRLTTREGERVLHVGEITRGPRLAIPNRKA
jgi:BirA family biotin operon repressor/biotin-[acetyl-CoA-carboxylase] ligase